MNEWRFCVCTWHHWPCICATLYERRYLCKQRQKRYAYNANGLTSWNVRHLLNRPSIVLCSVWIIVATTAMTISRDISIGMFAGWLHTNLNCHNVIWFLFGLGGKCELILLRCTIKWTELFRNDTIVNYFGSNKYDILIFGWKNAMMIH